MSRILELSVSLPRKCPRSREIFAGITGHDWPDKDTPVLAWKITLYDAQEMLSLKRKATSGRPDNPLPTLSHSSRSLYSETPKKQKPTTNNRSSRSDTLFLFHGAISFHSPSLHLASRISHPDTITKVSQTPHRPTPNAQHPMLNEIYHFSSSVASFHPLLQLRISRFFACLAGNSSLYCPPTTEL